MTSFSSFLNESVFAADTIEASANLLLPSPDARSLSCRAEELLRQSETGDFRVSLFECRKDDRIGVRGRHLERDDVSVVSSSGLAQSRVSPPLQI